MTRVRRVLVLVGILAAAAMNVSTEDVQRVARTYFTPNNRVVIHILPKGGTR